MDAAAATVEDDDDDDDDDDDGHDDDDDNTVQGCQSSLEICGDPPPPEISTNVIH